MHTQPLMNVWHMVIAVVFGKLTEQSLLPGGRTHSAKFVNYANNSDNALLCTCVIWFLFYSIAEHLLLVCHHHLLRHF